MAITLGSYPQLRRSVLDEGVTLHQTVRKTRGTHVMSTHYRVYFQERQKRDRNIPRTHSRSLCRNLINSPNHRALFPTSSTLCAPTRNPAAPLNLHRQLQISLWPLLLFSVSIIPPLQIICVSSLGRKGCCCYWLIPLHRCCGCESFGGCWRQRCRQLCLKCIRCRRGSQCHQIRRSG